MEDSEFRSYDLLIRSIYDASRNPRHAAEMLRRFSSAFTSDGMTVSVFQRVGLGIDIGLAAGMKKGNYSALKQWHAHPVILLAEKNQYHFARRLRDILPKTRLRTERWYKEFFEDSGVHHALLRDLPLGMDRARLILVRGPEKTDFTEDAVHRFELACSHFENAFRDRSRKWLAAACSNPEDFVFGLGTEGLAPIRSPLDQVELFLLRNTALSPAEARVAAALRTGHDLTSCASGLHLSMNTIRSHLKNIYYKLGISRLPELVYFLNNI